MNVAEIFWALLKEAMKWGIELQFYIPFHNFIQQRDFLFQA